MVKKYKGIELKYISVAPDGSLTELPNMTDDIFKDLVDKNGIYKAFIYKKEYMNTRVSLTPIKSIRLILEEEKKAWTDDRRNSSLWCVEQYDSRLLFAINIINYVGLKDPTLKVDNNCPYLEGFSLSVVEATSSDSNSIGLIKDTSGSDLHIRLRSSTEYPVGSLSLNPSEILTGITPVIPEFANGTKIQIIKKPNNTLFLDNPYEVGLYRTVYDKRSPDYYQNLFGLPLGAFKSGFTQQGFTQVQSIDTVLKDGEFLSVVFDTSFQIRGSILQIKNALATGGFENINVIGSKYSNSLYRFGSLIKEDKNSDTPKLRLLLLKTDSAGYMDTNIDIILSNYGYYINDILALNNEKVVACSFYGLFKLFNGVLKKHNGVSIDDGYLRISDKTDVGFEKNVVISSEKKIISLSASNLENESNYSTLSDPKENSYFTNKVYMWK